MTRAGEGCLPGSQIELVHMLLGGEHGGGRGEERSKTIQEQDVGVLIQIKTPPLQIIFH